MASDLDRTEGSRESSDGDEEILKTIRYFLFACCFPAPPAAALPFTAACI